MQKCLLCGNETEWDESLGSDVFCVWCWDSITEGVPVKVLKQRRYYQEHKAEFAARFKLYYATNRDRLLADDRRFYREHPAWKRAYNRRYYRRFRDRLLAYAHRYYQEHRTEKLEYAHLCWKAKILGDILARCIYAVS